MFLSNTIITSLGAFVRRFYSSTNVLLNRKIGFRGNEKYAKALVVARPKSKYSPSDVPTRNFKASTKSIQGPLLTTCAPHFFAICSPADFRARSCDVAQVAHSCTGEGVRQTGQKQQHIGNWNILIMLTILPSSFMVHTIIIPGIKWNFKLTIVGRRLLGSGSCSRLKGVYNVEFCNPMVICTRHVDWNPPLSIAYGVPSHCRNPELSPPMLQRDKYALIVRDPGIVSVAGLLLNSSPLMLAFRGDWKKRLKIHQVLWS